MGSGAQHPRGGPVVVVFAAAVAGAGAGSVAVTGTTSLHCLWLCTTHSTVGKVHGDGGVGAHRVAGSGWETDSESVKTVVLPERNLPEIVSVYTLA